MTPRTLIENPNPIDLETIAKEVEASAAALEKDWAEFQKQFEVVENLRSNNKLTPEIEGKLYEIFAEAAAAANLPLSFMNEEQSATSAPRSKKFRPTI